MDRLGWGLRGQSCRSILARPSFYHCKTLLNEEFHHFFSHSMNHQGTETRVEPSVRGIQCTTNLCANTVYSTYIMCVYHVYVICHAFIILYSIVIICLSYLYIGYVICTCNCTSYTYRYIFFGYEYIICIICIYGFRVTCNMCNMQHA